MGHRHNSTTPTGSCRLLLWIGLMWVLATHGLDLGGTAWLNLLAMLLRLGK